MANSTLFTSASRNAPVATARNDAGGLAYALSAKGALAQLAVTGVFNNTFYTTAEQQLDRVKELLAQADPEYIARLAIYTRQKAFMKDMPAYFAATLAARDVQLLARVFSRIIDSGKMLRNFVQFIRSGHTGRKSLGTRPKKLVAEWLNNASDAQFLHATVGNAPSLADVVRLSHPKAASATRNASLRRVVGRDVSAGELPENWRALDAFRMGEGPLPNAPFELLTAMNLSDRDWAQIARNATWTQTRKNLNTFNRHRVFDDREMVELLAARLRNPEFIKGAKAFPYELLAAYVNINEGIPYQIAEALQDAMEIATQNVPEFGGQVAVLMDVSSSMDDPVTGHRVGSTSKVRCVDVAALFASAVLRKNASAQLVPFDTRIHELRLNPRDSVMTNATRLAAIGKGGTDCSVGVHELNIRGTKAELVIIISDNESWVDTRGNEYYGRTKRSTALMARWKEYKRRVPRAKLVCLDIAPIVTSQACEGGDVLNIGGFSDEVFNTINLFAQGKLSDAHWVGEIERVALN